jgi:hypothetical protein
MWPERGKDELISHFIDHAPEGEAREGRFYIMASWADNPHLKEEERERLRKSVPSWQLEAREHGIPVFGQGKVFTMKEADLFVEPFEIPKHFARVYGLDPSSSSGGTWGFVLLAHDRDKDIVYAVADYKLSNATPTEHASNISRMIPDWCIGMVDPAGAGENMHSKEKTFDFLTERSGLQLVKANKANHAKEAMIDEIISRSSDRFRFSGSIKEEVPPSGDGWRQYARMKQSPPQKNDHCIDALFYALMLAPGADGNAILPGEWQPLGDAGYVKGERTKDETVKGN